MVTLEKKIPMQAGLGGGSSDAAATLLGLRRLWKLRVPDEEIHVAAARLGSDVPFFLVGGTVLGLGRGDELYPLEALPRHWVVLAIPSFGVATADAYRWFDEAQERSRGAHPTLFPNVPLVNDLEAPVIERHPEIGQLKQRFTDRGALMSGMTGSGSTVFGVFTSAPAAAAAARALKSSGAHILTARFLGRLPAVAASGKGGNLPVSPSIDYNLRLRCGGRAMPRQRSQLTAISSQTQLLESDSF